MRRLCATIGVFDGVHIGHQKILSIIKEKARELAASSLAFIINYPMEYYKGNFTGLLTSPAVRSELLSEYVDEIRFLDLLEIRTLTPEKFFQEYILKSGVVLIAVGEDFRFGKNASGSVATLSKLCQKNGVAFQCIPDVVDSSGKRISSTRIRSLLKAGRVHKAVELLGHPFAIDAVTKRVDVVEQGISISLEIDPDLVKLPAGTYEIEMPWRSSILSGNLFVEEEIRITVPLFKPVSLGSLLYFHVKGEVNVDMKATLPREDL